MTTKVWMQKAHIEGFNRRNAPATCGWSFPGHVFDGLVNGIATGFGGDAIIPEVSTSTQVPQRLLAASAGSDLATPVAYWFQRLPIRVRVGSTTASAVPATSGLVNTITQNVAARGVFRANLADVNAAAHILIDQGGLLPIPCGTNTPWEVAYHIANVTNGSILAANGFAEIGVVGGAVAVDPTAVINAAALVFKLGAGNISLVSVATTATTIATRTLPTGDFVLRFEFNPSGRVLSAFIDNSYFGSYILPTAVTAVELGARVCHLAAYTAASHDPLGVDIDGVVVNVPVQIA